MHRASSTAQTHNPRPIRGDLAANFDVQTARLRAQGRCGLRADLTIVGACVAWRGVGECGVCTGVRRVPVAPAAILNEDRPETRVCHWIFAAVDERRKETHALGLVVGG